MFVRAYVYVCVNGWMDVCKKKKKTNLKPKRNKRKQDKTKIPSRTSQQNWTFKSSEVNQLSNKDTYFMKKK